MSSRKINALKPGTRVTTKGGEAMRWSVHVDGTLADISFPTPLQEGMMSVVNMSSAPARNDARYHVTVL